MLLKDKVVIVSGIGPGLGQELSTLAAKEGAAAVVLAARTEAKLDAAEQEIRDLGLDTKVLKVPTDISDVAQCQNLADKTTEAFGRIDVLFNSAYDAGNFEPIAEADLDGWRRSMEVNFFGSMQLTQACVPAMRKAGGGAIVMIATMVEHKPLATQGGYGASKAALRNATKHLALELGADNIRVNSAHMGWMWGPSVEGYFDWQVQETGRSKEEMIAEVTRNIPLGIIPDDADCAKAAVFLASDYAAVVTGAALDVNGGEYMPV
ncbi:SDR family oxidoreductase [Parahaliea sp. F7430]|uniref:SDR family oxidoreductase n=1 Tax=Sediminihaliea albiluteola TaxID=2758564 RepID=A0A7W2TVI3_9GAMM|nr:SDR family oxidoreductase [Sediminihaliea albiluteola]MBA6412737.1 SDR family oxidoreductase [Sediminihaliea albiluteola]